MVRFRLPKPLRMPICVYTCSVWAPGISPLLNRLQEDRGIAYLFICHDIALVQDFCDRVIVMHEGKIVEEGIPDEIINNPQQAYTQKLIDSVL